MIQATAITHKELNSIYLRTRNMMKFLGWLQNFHPEMHRLVIERIGEAPANDALTISAGNLNGMGQFDFSNIFGTPDTSQIPPPPGGVPQVTLPAAKEWWESGIEAIGTVGTAVLQYKTQKDLIDLQMSRIEQGLEPIDTALIAPTVRVQADLPPAIQKDITDMKRTAVFAVAGIGLAIVAFLFMGKKKGRR